VKGIHSEVFEHFAASGLAMQAGQHSQNQQQQGREVAGPLPACCPSCSPFKKASSAAASAAADRLVLASACCCRTARFSTSLYSA
jgi:hypothetical protein